MALAVAVTPTLKSIIVACTCVPQNKTGKGKCVCRHEQSPAAPTTAFNPRTLARWRGRTPRFALWYAKELPFPVANTTFVGPAVLMGHVGWAIGRTILSRVVAASWLYVSSKDAKPGLYWAQHSEQQVGVGCNTQTTCILVGEVGGEE